MGNIKKLKLFKIGQPKFKSNHKYFINILAKAGLQYEPIIDIIGLRKSVTIQKKKEILQWKIKNLIIN